MLYATILMITFQVQTTYNDCMATCTAIGAQVLTINETGVNPGDLSGRYISLACVQTGGIDDPNKPFHPYNAAIAYLSYGCCTKSLCAQNATTITQDMLDDALPRVPDRIVTYDNIGSLTNLVNLINNNNCIVLFSRLGHAYVIIGTTPEGGLVVVDPYRSPQLEYLGARVIEWSPAMARFNLNTFAEPGTCVAIIRD